MLKNNYTHIFIIILLNLLYTIIINNYIQTEELYYSFLSESYPKELANYLFEQTHSYKFIVYIIIPIIILLRTLIFAAILDALLMCRNIYNSGSISSNFRFGQFWKIFISAEWSYIIFIITKFIWFGFINTDYNYEELIDYSPFSLYSIWGNYELDLWLIYPLKVFNLFELAYLIIAIIVCRETLKLKYIDSIYYIFISYLIPLFIFIIFIMYINLHFQ